MEVDQGEYAQRVDGIHPEPSPSGERFVHAVAGAADALHSPLPKFSVGA